MATFGSLDNIFGDTQEDKDKLKNPANSSQSRTVSADPLENIFANSPKPTPKQVQVESAAKPEEPKSFFDKAVNVVTKVATSVGNWFNEQQKKNDEASFKMQQLMYGKGTITKDPITGKNTYTTPQLTAYNNAKTPDEKAKILEDAQQEVPLIKFLNSSVGQKITGAVYNATSNVPLKIYAGIKAIGDETYDEAYSALVAKSKDPNNPRWEKILYGLQDSGVQSAIGALLAVGTSYITRNPKAGQAVSLAYFAPISAESQRQEKGKVTSLGNIAIDTVGDTVLSGVAESALKSFAKEGAEVTLKSLAAQGAKGFATEGGTEVAQSFLKYGNDYKNAKTEAEKQAVVKALTDYVKTGQMTDEFLIGGLAGAGTTIAATGAGKVLGGGEGEGSLQPVKNLETTTGGGAEAPKGTLKGEFNVNFAEVRDEAVTLAQEAANDPQNDAIAQRLAIVQDQLSDYQKAVKERPVYISDDTQENPLATIETVQYPDGKFSYSFSADTQSNSVQSPFINTETYATKEEAIAAGKKQILEWVKAQLPNAQGEELAKLKEIQQEIKKPTKVKEVKVKQEKGAENAQIEPQKEGETAVVKSNAQEKTQVSPNVEKTRAGVYRTTQYSQKGEAQGKAEARFTRSKKTGKMYFEVTKDGERIERIPLEKAKKKYDTKDRPTMVERAVNGKFNKETGQWDMRQSNAPVIRNTSQNQVEKKPVKTKGEVKRSRAFQRVQERLGEYADFDVNYNRLNLAEDTAKALEFIEKYPKEAKRIALGLQGAPEGVTETAISIALAEKASESKDYALQAQLERSRSLRQTRRGQEIVAERGRFNENSPHFFMQQVLAARLEKAGKTKFQFLTRNKAETKAQGVEAKIKEGTENIKQTVKRKLTAADLAQNVIDSLTC